MSRRFVAPLLLLAAAVVSLAAVFEVHRIEAGGGPVGEPSVTRPYFSPDGDGVQDETDVAFTTQRPERVTVQIVDAETGHLVRELLHGRRVDGRVDPLPSWNGRDEDGDRAPDGTYVARITLRGSSRVFEPVNSIVVDRQPPTAKLDTLVLEDGQLQGLAFVTPGTNIVAYIGDDLIKGGRSFTPKPGAVTARPHGHVASGTVPVRFVVPVGEKDLTSVVLYAQDLAGNRTTLPFGTRLAKSRSAVPDAPT